MDSMTSGSLPGERIGAPRASLTGNARVAAYSVRVVIGPYVRSSERV